MASNATQTASAAFLLPKDVTPVHYDLTLKSDLKEQTFEGKVEIALKVNKATSEIVLHAMKPLKLHAALLTSLTLKTDSSLNADAITMDEKLERATVSFPNDLQPDSDANLAITFSGTIDPTMAGYYRSSHSPDPEKPDEKDFYALTQFEPTAARSAFPCFDEPALKATLSFTHIHRSDTTSLANMNAVSAESSDGVVPKPFAPEGTHSITAGKTEKGPATTPDSSSEWTVTKYAKTPKTATYLYAWANGKFKYLESSYKSPLTQKTIPLRIYTTPEHIHQAQLALDTKAAILPIYEKIFDIPYPLPKLDTLVASDFDAGAMENWGLITGRTSIYLYDDKASGILAKKTTVGVQSHEVAHQWFGNIVTMEWWDNLWLNEAFATLMGEIIIINELHPEWRIHSEFINAHLKRALQLDSLRSSHPIEMPCPDASMINQIFDAISYSKGASVLKMLANSIGEKTFLKGVSLYLKKHLYGNSRTADLWAGISEASGLDVAAVMANWTLKIGFPVVTVEETAEGLKLTQNRFLSTGDVKPEEDETLWWIPLELKTVKDGKATVDSKVFLTERSLTIPMEDVKNTTYKINAETAGVYRTNYPPERLVKLGEEASKENSVLSLNDRMGLVQDAALLAKAGYAKTSSSLSLMSKMSNEKEYLVWTEIGAALSEIASTWWEEPEEVRKGIDALRGKLASPLVERLGFDSSDSEDSEVRELRSTAISQALAAKEPKTLDEAMRRFGLLVDQNDDNAIPGDLRSAIFVAAVKNGGEREYEKVLEIYKKPLTPQHKQAAMRALASAPTDALRQRTFSMILSGEVKTQDIMYFFGSAAAYPEARRAIWQYFQDNYAAIELAFKGNFSFTRIVQYAFEQLSSEKDAKAVEAFFNGKETKAYAQVLSQGLDNVRSRAGWLSRDRKDVSKWLASEGFVKK